MRSPASTTTKARRGGPPVRSGGRLGSDEVTVSGLLGAMPGHVTLGGGGAQHSGERVARWWEPASSDGLAVVWRWHVGSRVRGARASRVQARRAVKTIRRGSLDLRAARRWSIVALRLGEPVFPGARVQAPERAPIGGVTVSTGVLNVRIACRGCSHSHAKICGNHSCQRWQLRPYGHRRLTRGDISAQGASVGTGV